MRAVIIALAAALSAPANADELMAIATAQSGSTLRLYRETCAFVDKMPDSRLRRGVYLLNPDNSIRWSGCWLESHDMIQINWADGAKSELPKARFQWELTGRLTS